MNIERYKWPVIVAAGLHGALFLVTPDTTAVVRSPPLRPDPGPKLPVEQIEMRDPVEPASGGASGAVDPLPGLDDIPPPSNLLKPFTVPVIDAGKPMKDVVKLPDPGTIGNGPGEGIGPGFGPPRLPSVGSLDRTPRAMTQAAPDYPYTLKQQGISGSVTVEFVVGTDGHVISAEAVRWSHREFADPAVRAVLRWKFEPGTIDGRKVRFRMAVPIEFNVAS